MSENSMYIPNLIPKEAQENPYLAYKLTGTNAEEPLEITPTTAKTDAVWGFADDPAYLGQYIKLQVPGFRRDVLVDGAVAIGAALTLSATSPGYLTTAASGDAIVAMALEASATEGKISAVTYQPGQEAA